jgi:flavin-dependent dehydrogenase
MQHDYDVVIIGGAFSGAATALMLKRKRPDARVLIVEKTQEFDRKVGESTTELSSCYMTRILGLTHYLGHEQLAKQGLRMWFCNRAEQAFDDCVEIGARYQTRLQTFQVDRAKLDSHILGLAVGAGSDLWRPAKVTRCELAGKNGQQLSITIDEGRRAVGANNENATAPNGETTTRVPTSDQRMVTARWVIDASGRAAFLTRKLGYFRPNKEHPINAVWARFTDVKEWDSYEWRERFPNYANACLTSREWATNHLMGHGWWCWIIPLRGGDVSAGIVYDSRIFALPEGASLGERLHAHIRANPVGREIFGEAKIIENDVHAFSSLPYDSEKVCDDGWAVVGDAASFIDPLYSPGLDFCSYTSYYVSELLARNLAGENVSEQLRYYNEQFPITYRLWFETLYKDKYYYMGDAELMSAALLLDVGTYFLGLVIPVYKNPEREFAHLPFEGKPGRLFAGMMKFYNRRLVTLAKRRLATGCFGRRNAGWRELYDGFVPDFRLRHLIRKGLLRWWKCELVNLGLLLRSRKRAAEIAAEAGARSGALSS